MAWDILRRKKIDRDWSLGTTTPPKTEVWTPAIVAALLATVDKEISRNANRVIGLMRKKAISEPDRSEFSAFFKKWRGYKETLDRRKLGEATTVNVLKTFRSMNADWSRRMDSMAPSHGPTTPSAPVTRRTTASKKKTTTRSLAVYQPKEEGKSSLPLILGGIAAAAGIAMITMGKK